MCQASRRRGVRTSILESLFKTLRPLAGGWPMLEVQRPRRLQDTSAWTGDPLPGLPGTSDSVSKCADPTARKDFTRIRACAGLNRLQCRIFLHRHRSVLSQCLQHLEQSMKIDDGLEIASIVLLRQRMVAETPCRTAPEA